MGGSPASLTLDEISEGHRIRTTAADGATGLNGFRELDVEGLLNLLDELVFWHKVVGLDLGEYPLLLLDLVGERLEVHPSGLTGLPDDPAVIVYELYGSRTGVDILRLHAPLALLEPLVDDSL